MISYVKFKEIFDSLNPKWEAEIEIRFKNRKNSYMIIKYDNCITFQRCGKIEEQSNEIKFESLDELYNTKTIDDITLKEEWDNIDDIMFDSLSVISNKEELFKLYGVKI